MYHAWGEEKYNKILDGSLKGRGHFGDLGVGERMPF
jgi:hypothetical protein